MSPILCHPRARLGALLALLALAVLAAGCGGDHAGHGEDAGDAGAHDGAAHEHAANPYAGDAGRAIAALADDEIRGLLAGEGLGYARAAEMNGYPGPRHVLDLAEALALTDAQRADVQAVFDAMRAEARAAGGAYVGAERRLDSLFAHALADSGAVAAATREAALAEARVRQAHLDAHLATHAHLTDEQIAAYARLRGYAE